MIEAGRLVTTKQSEDGPAFRSVSILGVRVDDVTNDETLGFIGTLVRSGRKHQVATINPEFIMEAQRNPEFMKTLNRTSLSFPDGIGVLIASRMFGRPMRERVAGVDIVERLADMSAERGYSLFLLGAAPGIAEKTAEILSARAPGVRIAGTYSGSPSPAEEAEICSTINAVRPDILFVAYGAPKQDLWIARNLSRLDVSVAMGVGGSFDFISGISKRAPAWIRRIGLEWLYRLLNEPTRWRRMLALPQFAASCVLSVVRTSRRDNRS